MLTWNCLRMCVCVCVCACVCVCVLVIVKVVNFLCQNTLNDVGNLIDYIFCRGCWRLRIKLLFFSVVYLHIFVLSYLVLDWSKRPMLVYVYTFPHPPLPGATGPPRPPGGGGGPPVNFNIIVCMSKTCHIVKKQLHFPPHRQGPTTSNHLTTLTLYRKIVKR